MSRADNYSDVLRYTPGACLVADAGVVLAANAEATEVLGVPLGRLIGIPLEEFLLLDHHEPCSRALRDAAATTTTVGVRLAQALTPVELSVRRLPDDKVAVGIRSTEVEHHYSSLAKADLTHDALTGLSNRYHLLAQLQDRLKSHAHSPLAVVGLWVDELPSLVETKGQRVVDRVIKDVGQRLQSRLRGPDVIGRFEPAGFVTLLTSDASVDQLTEIASRLRDEVAFPVELDAGLVSFTASVAVGTLANRQPTIERVLDQLDEAGARLGTGAGSRTEVLEF